MLGILTYLIVTILLGAASCFWGHKLYFPVLMAAVFVLTMVGITTYFGTATTTLIIAAILGVAAAIVVRLLYSVGAFLIGMLAGAELGLLLTAFLPKGSPEAVIIIIVLAFGLLIGACAVRWQDKFIIIATAFNGGSMIADSVLFLILNITRLGSFDKGTVAQTINDLGTYINTDFMKAHTMALLIVTVALAVVGYIYQARHAKAKEKSKTKEAAAPTPDAAPADGGKPEA